MKLLMIKPGPNVVTGEDYANLRGYLDSCVKSGICVVHHNIVSYEVVEFDSIEFDVSLYSRLSQLSREEMKKHHELMEFILAKKGESK